MRIEKDHRSCLVGRLILREENFLHSLAELFRASFFCSLALSLSPRKLLRWEREKKVGLTVVFIALLIHIFPLILSFPFLTIFKCVDKAFLFFIFFLAFFVHMKKFSRRPLMIICHMYAYIFRLHPPQMTMLCNVLFFLTNIFFLVSCWHVF